MALTAMSHSSRENVAQLTTRLERFQLSNAELSQQLSDALSRSQRLALSLGFRNIYEAQAALDTADLDLSYRQCFDELEVLRQQVGDLTAQRDAALARASVVEGQRQSAPRDRTASGELHLRDLIPDEIAVDVLPQALRLAYCEASGLRQRNVDDLRAEGTIRTYELTGQGLEILKKNAKVVGEWEDIFSCWYKDRTSKVSWLARQESFRFQRALYRIMLVSWIYGMGSIPESDMQNEHYPHSFYTVYQSRQTEFLMKYPSDELFEINRVVRFLIRTAGIAMEKVRCYQTMRDVYDWDGLYLFAGPAYIMNAYRNWEMDTDEVSELASYLDDGGPYSSFLTCGLAQIFTDRTGEDFDWHITQRILDSVEGGDDPCTQCQSTNDFCIGRFLKNESSWDDMILTHILPDFFSLMSGMVIQYFPQRFLILNAIKTTPSRQLMEEIFEPRQGKYITWNREDWACDQCWQSLIFDTIPIWWAKRSQRMCGSDGG